MTSLVFLSGSFALAKDLNTSETKAETHSIATAKEYRAQFGVMGGIADTNKGGKSSGEFGINFGFQPFIPIGLGFEASGSKYETSNGELKDKTNLLLTGSYNFSGTTNVFRDTYIGAAMGLIVRSENSDATVGPLAGFDIPLKPAKNVSALTIGANAKYLFSNATEVEGVAVNGVLKYWF